MGTTAQKLEYLGTTKSQLKDQINYGLPTEKQITNSTTFRNYVSSIFEAFLEALRNPDTLFTNLPKTSGSGSQITLNNTANAPMRITLNPTAITQDGTPTPSSPQDIHTTTGDNVIRDEGKNILGLTDGTYTNNGITAVVNKGKITLNGTASETSFIQIPLISEINLLNQTVTLSTNNSTTGGDNLTEMRLYTSGSVYLPCAYNIVDNSATYTNKTDTYVRLQIRTSSGISYNNFVLKPMLEKGSVATDYEPYNKTDYPLTLGDLEYNKIGNYEDEFIIPNKNSLETTLTTQTLNGIQITRNVDGSITLNGTTTQTFNIEWKTNNLTLEAGTYYIGLGTITNSFNLYFNKSGGGFEVLGNPASSSYYTLTLNEETTYTGLKSYVGTNITFNNQTFYPMITKTLPFNYEPYNNGKWYLKKNIGKVVLDGSESWSERTNTSGTKQFYAPTDLPVSSVLDATQKCTHFSNYKQSLYNYGVVGDFTILTNTRVFYGCVSNDLTLADFKTSLASNNLEVYYILATPTYTKITGELAEQLEQINRGMLSYDGTTNISQVNNDLAFVINASGITK